MTELSNFNAHLHDVMQWHFSEKTGSPFWLDKRKSLGFDPLRDVRSFCDLALFPDVADELRDTPVEMLIARGLQHSPIAGVFESGGTTGRAKRVIVFEEWLELLVDWRLRGRQSVVSDKPRNTLALIPTGPHVVGAINRLRASCAGGQFFAIDLDPRWVKRMIAQGKMDVVNEYSEHLLDQAADIIETQNISYLIATPPLLERIARRSSLVERLNSSLELITWGGTQMDPDTLDFLRSSIFPNVRITASYGSTMILGEAKAREGEDFNGSPIFDTFAPLVVFDVVEPLTRKVVPFGERGTVVMNHLSKYAFFPNVLERDTAVRLCAPEGCPGASVAEIRPVSAVAGKTVIEGVY